MAESLRRAWKVAVATGAWLLLSGASADTYKSTYQPLPRTPVFLTGATILDGAGGRIDGGDVVLDQGRIVAVGRGLDQPAGATVIDARGKWITPGVIDVHTHAGTFALPITANDAEASDVAEISTPNAANTWIEHAVRATDPVFGRALAGGVTTMQILPGSTPLFGGVSVVVKPVPVVTIQAMKFPDAPLGIKMACGANPKEYFGSKGMAPNSRQGEYALIRAAFLEAQSFLERRAHEQGPRGGHGGRAPRERDLRVETLAAVLEGQLRVHMHCYRADDMANMIALSHEFGFHIAAFHHAAEAYKIAPLLASEGVCVAGWPDWWGFKREAEDAIRENVAFVDAAGGCAMMHSDIPVVGDRLNTEAAKAAAAGRRAGLSLPPERVIRWITSNPAKALGLEDRIGQIKAGMSADVVVWSGDPFSVYTRAEKVFIDGALAYDRAQPPRDSDLELGRAARQVPP
jgi:imidazolonepropionase-like amidohydrolase